MIIYEATDHFPPSNFERWLTWIQRYHNHVNRMGGHERRPYVITVLRKDESNQATSRYAHKIKQMNIEKHGTGIRRMK